MCQTLEVLEEKNGVCVDGVDNRIFQLNFKAVSLEKLCMLCFFFFSFKLEEAGDQ